MHRHLYLGYCCIVDLQKPLHFEQISELVGISKQEVSDLNPQYVKDIIPGNANKTYILRIPYNYTNAFVDKEKEIYTYKDSIFFNPIVFNETKARVSNNETITHKVKRGETLGRIAQKYGVRNVELEILLFLYHSPCGDTAKDIVEEKNLSKAHISKSVDNLRAKGFVVLTEDENDRRKRHIELTEKAVEAAKNMMEVHNECKEVVMRYVTDEEKELMNQIMQKMLRSLDEELQK